MFRIVPDFFRSRTELATSPFLTGMLLNDPSSDLVYPQLFKVFDSFQNYCQPGRELYQFHRCFIKLFPCCC